MIYQTNLGKCPYSVVHFLYPFVSTWQLFLQSGKIHHSGHSAVSFEKSCKMFDALSRKVTTSNLPLISVNTILSAKWAFNSHFMCLKLYGSQSSLDIYSDIFSINSPTVICSSLHSIYSITLWNASDFMVSLGLPPVFLRFTGVSPSFDWNIQINFSDLFCISITCHFHLRNIDTSKQIFNHD